MQTKNQNPQNESFTLSVMNSSLHSIGLSVESAHTTDKTTHFIIWKSRPRLIVAKISRSAQCLHHGILYCQEVLLFTNHSGSQGACPIDAFTIEV